MQCPLCTIELNVNSQEGIEVDTCPKCQGVWLDQNDLDKFIEFSLTHPSCIPNSKPSSREAVTSAQTRIHGYPQGKRFANTQNKSSMHKLFEKL